MVIHEQHDATQGIYLHILEIHTKSFKTIQKL